MALHYDLSEIKDVDSLWVEAEKDKDGKQLYRLEPITDMFIWMTMFVGISRITEENWKEVFTRIYVYDLTCGPLLYQKNKNGKNIARFLKPEDVIKRIGLKTNASPLTDKEFLKKCTKGLLHGETEYRQLSKFYGAMDDVEKLLLKYSDPPHPLAQKSKPKSGGYIAWTDHKNKKDWYFTYRKLGSEIKKHHKKVADQHISKQIKKLGIGKFFREGSTIGVLPYSFG